MKRYLYIVFLLFLCSLVRAEEWTGIECGEWLTIKAHPFEDFAFVEWSDGNKDPVRSIQINEDAVYIAYFASKCEEYANWPVVALYDWLMMVNVAKINAMGYHISPQNVTWYRVIGEPDDMHNNFPQDDQEVARNSFYLTINQNFQGTGSYYAIVDVSNAQGKLCDGLMRTVIINYSGTGKAPQVALTPTYAHPGQRLNLSGLDPNETTTIQVFSTSGQLIRTYQCSEEQFHFSAEVTAGCYHIRIASPSRQQAIKYLVKQ